jgi:hypothetical protein
MPMHKPGEPNGLAWGHCMGNFRVEDLASCFAVETLRLRLHPESSSQVDRI